MEDIRYGHVHQVVALQCSILRINKTIKSNQNKVSRSADTQHNTTQKQTTFPNKESSMEAKRPPKAIFRIYIRRECMILTP